MDDDVAALVVDNGSGKFREIREQGSSTKKQDFIRCPFIREI